jgi:hypothetical protein
LSTPSIFFFYHLIFKSCNTDKSIEKLLASDDIRQCRPLPDSAFKNELEHNQDFVDLSCRIAGVLFDYMHAHTTIPGADLAVVDFTRDGAPWLGILKLNYKNGYTHYTENVEGAPVNSIIQQLRIEVKLELTWTLQLNMVVTGNLLLLLENLHKRC